MEQQQPIAAAQPNVSSFGTRMTNVFMSPSELYTEVASAPIQKSSWLIPYLVTLIFTVVSTLAVYNNPALRQQIFDMQEKAMQKMVTDGWMTQDQLDQQMDAMKNSGPVLFVVFGSGFQIITTSVIFFLGTLLLWLAAKVVMKFTGTFGKVLEVYGLALWISVLGTIVTIILMYLMNSMTATPGGGLLLGESFDPTNTGHKLLAGLNIFMLWEVAIIGLGLAKVSGKSAGLGMAISFALWAVFIVGFSMIG